MFRGYLWGVLLSRSSAKILRYKKKSVFLRAFINCGACFYSLLISFDIAFCFLCRSACFLLSSSALCFILFFAMFSAFFLLLYNSICLWFSVSVLFKYQFKTVSLTMRAGFRSFFSRCSPNFSALLFSGSSVRCSVLYVRFCLVLLCSIPLYSRFRALMLSNILFFVSYSPPLFQLLIRIDVASFLSSELSIFQSSFITFSLIKSGRAFGLILIYFLPIWSCSFTI